jgi:hypothetical protein
MGGASSQVSQMAPTPAAAAAIPAKYKFAFTIEQDTYHLYTHSYLGFGAEQGREQLNKVLAEAAGVTPPVKDPCLNPGYTRAATEPITEPYQGPAGIAVVGGSDSDNGVCMSSLTNIFKYFKPHHSASSSSSSTPAPSRTTEEVCDLPSQPAPHSFGCIHQPDFVAQSTNFLVFENFYYMASGINVLQLLRRGGVSLAHHRSQHQSRGCQGVRGGLGHGAEHVPDGQPAQGRGPEDVLHYIYIIYMYDYTLYIYIHI